MNETETAIDQLTTQLIGRLTAIVEAFEQAVPRLTASEAIGPIVATVESSREIELAQRLDAAEKTIADLRASAASATTGRRTLPVSLAARHDGATAEPGALDAALTSLSLEQRIAVKSQLLRAGLI